MRSGDVVDAMSEENDEYERQLNVNIAELEKKQDDLDLQIQNLEKYKELWAEISNAYQTSQDEMNAKALLGQQIQDNTLLIESYEEKVEY